jgi:prepilin peptidase CpaA
MDFSTATLAAVGVTFLAALADGTTGTVPNRLTLSVLVGAPLVHAFLSGPGGLGLSLFGALACGAVPLLLFTRGGVGGGDVKLFASLGAIVGAQLGLHIELVSLFVALPYALLTRERGVRMGIPVALATLLVLCVPEHLPWLAA